MDDGCDFKHERTSYCLTRKAEGRIMVFSAHESLGDAIEQYHSQNLDERGGSWSIFCVVDIIELKPRHFMRPVARHEMKSYLGGDR